MKVYLIEHGNYYEHSMTDSIHMNIESARIRVKELLLENKDEYIQSPDDEDTWAEKKYCQDYISIYEFDVEGLSMMEELIQAVEDVCYNRGEIDYLRKTLEKFKE